RDHFAFRTTKSDVEFRNFAVSQSAPPQFPPVQPREDAVTIRLDNGLISLTYSKSGGTFTNLSRYVNGKLKVLAEGPEAYYWDCVTAPDGAQDARASDGNVRLHQPDPLRLIASPDSAEIVATMHPTWRLAFEVKVHFVLHRGDGGFYSY